MISSQNFNTSKQNFQLSQSASSQNFMLKKRLSKQLDQAQLAKLRQDQTNLSRFNGMQTTTTLVNFAQRNEDLIKSQLLESGHLNRAAKLQKGVKLTNRVLNVRDILRCFTLVFIVSMSSLSLIFEHISWKEMWSQSYTYLLFGALYLDLLLLYFYGVQHHGHYVSSIKGITLYLLKEKWCMYLIPFFCYVLFVLTGLEQKCILFGIFSAVWEITYIIKSISERIFNSIRLLYIIKLVKLFLMILFFAHSFACFWIYVPKHINSNNWLVKYGFSDQDWSVQYVNALYYITISMVTVGYGDIAPTNTDEKVLCSILIVILCGIYGYSLNQIGVIFNELNKNSISILEKKIHMNKFMLRKNVSETLQNKVREYLDYFWEQKFDDDSQMEGLNIIKQLNSNLKKQLIYESNNLVIRDSPVFAQNFSSEFLKRITEIITEQKYMPEEIIYEKDSSDNNSIYFIEQGDIQTITDVKNKISIIQELKSGDNFGYFSFFTGQPREFTTRSKNFSVLLKIDLVPFLEILKDFEEDHEKYYYIRDQLLYNKQFDIISQQCSECQESNHFINSCPKIHFCSDRLELVKNDYSLTSLQLERDNQFVRKKKKVLGFKSSFSKILDRFLDFAVSLDQELNKYEEDYLIDFYFGLENQTPLNSENEQKPNFQQLITKIMEEDNILGEESSSVYQHQYTKDNQRVQFADNPLETIQSQNEKTNLNDQENNTLRTQFLTSKGITRSMSIYDKQNTLDETSILENARSRKHSGNLSVSSYSMNNKADPNSNMNIGLKLNQYFQQNTFEDSPKDAKILKLYSTLRSNDELNIPMFETPASRFSKLNIKREKSIMSFRKISQDPSISIRSKQHSAIKEEMDTKTLHQKKRVSYLDVEPINHLSESYQLSQLSRKKLLKLEFDAMKIMKIYFVKDNFNNVIARFNATNRYYSILSRKEREKYTQGGTQYDQSSRMEDNNEQTEKIVLDNNSVQSSNKDILNLTNLQNDPDQSGSGKLTAASRLLRQQTVNIIQQNKKNKASSIFKKFVFDSMKGKKEDSLNSSQQESENNKIQDEYSKQSQNSQIKMSNFLKLAQQNSGFINTQQYPQITQNLSDVSYIDMNKSERRDPQHKLLKDCDLQNSDIQVESQINMFTNTQYQNKKIQQSSQLSESNAQLQNDPNMYSLQSHLKNSSSCIAHLKESVPQEQKDQMDNTDNIFCQFDSFSEL